jgi:predicted ester cyclase
MAPKARIADLVQRFYRDAWNRWDDSAPEKLLAVDFVFRGSLGDEAHGPAGFRAYREKVREAFPDFHNDVREVVVNGERAAVRLLCTAHHNGELFGIAPTGSPVAYEAAAFLRARDGQLQEAWVLGDLSGLRGQLNKRRIEDPLPTQTVTTVDGRKVILMDSITAASSETAGQIVVAGSHGGMSAGEFATRHRLRACFLNDAGVGKDRAGIVALGMLDADGVPGATVSHRSARIGNARDHWEHGVISHVNEAAAAVGLRVGMTVKNAVARLR